MKKVLEMVVTIIGVNTGEIITEGNWEQIKDVINQYAVVPNKRLYENYGITNNDVSMIYVVD